MPNAYASSSFCWLVTSGTYDRIKFQKQLEMRAVSDLGYLMHDPLGPLSISVFASTCIGKSNSTSCLSLFQKYLYSRTRERKRSITPKTISRLSTKPNPPTIAQWWLRCASTLLQPRGNWLAPNSKINSRCGASNQDSSVMAVACHMIQGPSALGATQSSAAVRLPVRYEPGYL